MPHLRQKQSLLTNPTVYQVRKRSSDGRGAARVDKEGDINISFPKRPPTPPPKPGSASGSGSGSGSGSASLSSSAGGTAGTSQNQGLAGSGDEEDDGYEDQVADTDTHAGGGSDAWRFLLAGGIAGAGMSFLNVLCCSIGVQGVKCHARVQERKRIKGL